ncbi:MAG: class I SAM-dependent methyltransferase [Exiguobacterium chiriqhucha]|uniref:class I SAM-dependent methyltransferase n=1 Tax=Exiguobacterium chiriqhucha TaxID=1385984 RepID=UPI0014504ED3|nr:class I SAM-dependent methyltransferase [Exiguobacterium chiriqhucha]KAB2864795.1 MAG: class I SAM-dependent methyltransferase [Exiguobacterium chiriqhucha]
MRFMRLQTWIDSQYENPRGIVGTYIGEKMVRQHRVEVDWTIEQLHIQPDHRILDLGCGAGDALAQMLRGFEHVHVTGLDRSPTIIRSALRRNRTDVQGGRADVVEGDLGTLPFPDAQFDRVFSIHTLYFWEDVPAVLAEIDRVLVPGGSFVITYCDGKGDVTWDGIASIMREQFIPAASELGLIDVKQQRGPDSRDYHTVAVTGRKARP